MSTPALLALLGAHAATASFSPSDIANLLTWHKADAIGGLADGDPITTWADSSGNGWDGTGSGITRPLYKTAIYNGLPTVRFDGIDDVLATSSVPTTATDNFTQFTVGAATSGVADNHVPFFMGNGASNGWGVALGSGNGNGKLSWLRGGLAWHDAATNQTTDLRLLVGRRASGSFNMYLNGGASIVATSSAPNAPGTSYRFGSHTSGAFRALDACEGIVYTAALSDAQVNQVGSYLCTKWGLTWTTI